MIMATDELLSTSEAAGELGITDALVRRYCRDGRLKAVRLGERSWAIARKDLEKFKTIPRLPGRMAS